VKSVLQRILIVLLPLSALAATQPAPRKLPPNIVLITLDTVRADHLGCYGYSEIQTPTLDSLAHDGVVFERAISQVPLTWPSHAAILTGAYPFQNGVQDFTGQPLAPEFHSIAQALKQHGYATGAVVSAFVLDRSWGLNRGFDFYDDAFSAETFQKKDIGLVDRRAGESVSHAIAWVKKTPHRPFFLWLHLYDPHSPYDPPEPFHTQYKDHLYDGEIAYADHELGRLIAFLKQNHLYDHTMIAFLSDHGESLGDHGEHEHGFFVYNSTVHIPLIVKPPAGSGIQPSRVARPVETVAVAPALLQAVGIKDPIEKQFHSHGLFGPEAEKEDSGYSETFYPFSSFGWSPLHALETTRYHYIEAPEPELYDVIADPEEKNNLAGQQSATVAVLKDKVDALVREKPFTVAQGQASNVSPDAAEKLRALGYVSYRSAVSPEALAKGLADPKTKLWEFNAILEAGDVFQVNDFTTGQDLLAQVREKDPQIYIVPFMLGEVALRQQNWAEASSQLRRSLELNPNFDQAMVGLGRALLNQNNPEEAKRWVDKALRYNPQNYRAWYELAFIESKTDKTAALAAFEKTVSIQPNFALARRDFGMFQYQQKDYADAVTQLSKAIHLGMDKDPQLYNFLGISYSLTKRLPLAVESYQKALKIDPNLAEGHLNLGLAYEQMGQKNLAGQEYQQACKLKQDFCQLIQNRQKN
jgi:arylsulfatase A-like enzyme/Tfp pilus assembly protein PilF